MRRLCASFSVVFTIAACSAFGADEPTTTPTTTTSDAGADAGAALDATSDGGSGCTDTSSDAKNCGKCGHDCLGGSCVAGQCQPVMLTSFHARSVAGIGVSDRHVAWLFQDDANDEATLQWCTRSDGECKGTSKLGVIGSSVVGTPEAVYAATTGGTNGRIVRLAEDGVHDHVTASATDFHEPRGLFAGADGLVFFDYPQDSVANGVFRVARGASPGVPTRLGQLAAASHHWERALVAGERTFLFEYYDLAIAQIGADPKSFCSYASGCSAGVLGMAATSTSLVWAEDSNPPRIRSCALADVCDLDIKTVATNTSFDEKPHHLTYDGERLFVATFAGGGGANAKIYSCAPNDCLQSLTPFAVEPYLPAPVAVTPDAVYWLAGETSPADGNVPAPQTYRVMRRAR